MKYLLFVLFFVITACTDHSRAPVLFITSIDGDEHFELHKESKLAVLFVALSNPIALDEIPSLDSLNDRGVEVVAITSAGDAPGLVYAKQQQYLVPLVSDVKGEIARAFGGIDVTPTLFYIEQGRIIKKQVGNINLSEI